MLWECSSGKTSLWVTGCTLEIGQSSLRTNVIWTGSRGVVVVLVNFTLDRCLHVLMVMGLDMFAGDGWSDGLIHSSVVATLADEVGDGLLRSIHID